MWMHYTNLTDPVMEMDSCTESVIEDVDFAFKILCLHKKCGEEKSVIFVQEQNKK
jgi:hypothetical protein